MSRRRTTATTLAVLALLAATGGCAAQESEPKTAKPIEKSAASTTPAGAPGPVALRVTTEAVLKDNYPLLLDMVKARVVETVVRGTVTNVSYEHPEMLAKTVFTVDVEKSWRGRVPSTITVREDGGYIRIGDLAADEKDKFPDAVVSNPDAYEEITFEGADHPQVGQKVLLFLKRNPNPGLQGTYVPIGSSFGRLVLADDGAYKRAARGPGWQSEVAATDVHDALDSSTN